MDAEGTFEVELQPTDASPIETLALKKRFEGDLDGESEGTMLATRAEGGAVYTAMERVRGTLGGREGTFVLVHRGVMTEGREELEIMVAPGSGTGGLSGLHGEMSIQIDEGVHSYKMEYGLPEKPVQ
jgi:hypothetical protein